MLKTADLCKLKHGDLLVATSPRRLVIYGGYASPLLLGSGVWLSPSECELPTANDLLTLDVVPVRSRVAGRCVHEQVTWFELFELFEANRNGFEQLCTVRVTRGWFTWDAEDLRLPTANELLTLDPGDRPSAPPIPPTA